ncbi:MAG: pyruvate formate-lyase-activating protein [Clostridia bacterium]|nr:pyruvate formate-lyase-activating protein [Clostridia bacterium]
MTQSLIGRIHSFESFGTVDGPGIRSVVFLQGCHFRCLYCHNPDTWDMSDGTPITVAELYQRLMRFKPYFEPSGGGVTVSGGEPLLQMPFVKELFKLLRKEGIHTCLDTNGSYPESTTCKELDELLSYTDLVLLDIKHMNPESHKALTGFGPQKTLHFAKRLAEKGIPVWLRYVVVPGLTDSPEDLRAFKDFSSQQPNVEKVEYLPFHKLGEYKWEALGLSYSLKEVLPPSQDFMNTLQKP